MIPAALVGCAAVGAAVSAWGLARTGRAEQMGMWVGIAALLLVVVFAFAMDAPRIADGEGPVAGASFNGRLVPNTYLRLVIGLWALMSVLVVGIGRLLGGLPALRGLLPATLAALAGATVTLGASSLALGVAAATATGLAALVVVLAAEGPAAVSAAAAELRVTLLGGTLLLASVAAVPVLADLVLRGVTGASGSGSGADGAPAAAAAGGTAGAVIGLLTVVGALVVGLRYGVLPFHLRVPRLADVVHPVTLPLLLAWIPLPLAAVGIVAVDTLIAPLALPLDGERLIIVLFALLTLAGAALGAYLQDDIRHATGYLVVADAGLVILALAALDPAAWGPARAWIVVLAASKTALGAWSAVAEDRFGTRSIPDLRGWMRRSPMLAAALALTAVATFGLPGWVAFEARGTLATLVADGPAAVLLVLAGFLTLPTYIRLLVLGTGPVTSRVDGSVPERVVRRPRGRRGETLPVEQEGEATGAVAADSVTTAADAVALTQSGAPGSRERRGSTGDVSGTWGASEAGDASDTDGAGVGVPGEEPADNPGVRPRRRTTPAHPGSEAGRRTARRTGVSRAAHDGSDPARPGRAAFGRGAGAGDPRCAHILGSAGHRRCGVRAGPDRDRTGQQLTGASPPGRVTGASPPGRVTGAMLLPWGEDPAVDLALVADQLVVAEPESQLAGSGLGAVGGVHEVLRGLDREVAADRSGGSLVRASRAVHRPDDGDRVGALQGGRHKRPGGDELHEPLEERLVARGPRSAPRRARGRYGRA